MVPPPTSTAGTLAAPSEADALARTARSSAVAPGSRRNGESRRSDYTDLSRLIRERGLLERRPRYYAVRFTVVIGLFVGGWVAFALLGNSWWQLLVAAFMAIMFTQVAFLGHDVGHRQVFGSKRATRIAGLLMGNLGICMAYEWWIGKHTRHHANPNHVDDDPDVGVGLIVWSEDQAHLPRTRPGRWFGARQAYLFFPILLLEGFQLHVAGFRSLFDPEVKRKWIEGLLLTTHVVAYLSAVFLVLDPVKAIAFIVVHQGLFGLYMGCSFAPNHKGMPMLDEKTDYLRKQVLTSRNVRGNVIVDYAFGGLNYQVEHHLFPSMPMPNLRKAQPLVREYCERIGVPYTETGLLTSYREILGYLHEVGAPLRRSSEPARS